MAPFRWTELCVLPGTTLAVLRLVPSGLRSPRPERNEDDMRDPQALISTEQLAAVLGQQNLRIYDCTTYLEPPPPGSDEPYVAVPGRHTFEEAHIQGADFLDLQGEFSDSSTKLRFMMPASAQLAMAFGRHGFGNGTRVVLYSIGTMMWATRFWWMLRSLGFDNTAVLDGGLDKWRDEGRPLESGPPQGYPAPPNRGQAFSQTAAQ
jgi:thiosulfate/3-mercaptopyruvate sulfurtransferase